MKTAFLLEKGAEFEELKRLEGLLERTYEKSVPTTFEQQTLETSLRVNPTLSRLLPD